MKQEWLTAWNDNHLWKGVVLRWISLVEHHLLCAGTSTKTKAKKENCSTVNRHNVDPQMVSESFPCQPERRRRSREVNLTVFHSSASMYTPVCTRFWSAAMFEVVTPVIHRAGNEAGLPNEDRDADKPEGVHYVLERQTQDWDMQKLANDILDCLSQAIY